MNKDSQLGKGKYPSVNNRTVNNRNRSKIMHVKQQKPISMRVVAVSLWAVAVIFANANSAQAVVLLVPSGLNGGDQFQLVFVTSTTMPATSTDISDYNQHVQAAADAAGIGTGATMSFGPYTWTVDITWTAIGSTAVTSAAVNAPVSQDVYNLAGTKVDTAASFYDNLNPTLLASVGFDEYGNALDTRVWTGSLLNGLTDPNYHLGSTHAGGVRMGGSNSTSSGWLTDGLFYPPSTARSLYGLSGVLTAVPEPSTFAIWSLLGGIGLVVGHLRRRCKAA